MGSYTFKWPYPANEVFVTGSFDDWGKTVQLDRNGDVFEKEVQLPSADKVHYKFVVDGLWTTDTSAAQEDDGSGNINNVIYPGQIKQASTSSQTNGTTMATATPEATEAAIGAGAGAGIPKDSEKSANEATISSAAPESTTADLAKAVPLEQRSNVPGTFPETPGQEAETFFVNPIPASGTSGNPISLKPGEKVPDPSTFTSNTVQSTARTDPAGYAQDPSAATALTGQSAGPSDMAMPPVSAGMIPESSLPMGEPSQGFSDPGVTIQSAAPTSTTAALAATVPLESERHQANAESVADEVPKVVKDSIAESHGEPGAAANKEAVEEKKEVEDELQKRVTKEESTGTPAPSTPAGIGATQTNGGAPADQVPETVKHSIAEAHKDPEAAANPEAVEEKKEMEDELQKLVAKEEHAGAPAPTATAATIETAPRATGVERESQPKSPGADNPQGPIVTTGVASAKAPEVSGPGATPGAGARTGQTEGSTTLMPSTIPDKAAAPSEAQTSAPSQPTAAPAAAEPQTAATSTPSQPTTAPATTAPQAETGGTTNGPSMRAGQRQGLNNGVKEEKKKKKSFWSKLKEKLK